MIEKRLLQWMQASRFVRQAFNRGDSFAAGFTFGLARGLSVPEAAAIGAERGALTLTLAGAP